MRVLRVALGVSLALHAALVVLLASLGAPSARTERQEPSRVILVMPPKPSGTPEPGTPTPERVEAGRTGPATARGAPAQEAPAQEATRPAPDTGPGSVRLPLPEERLDALPTAPDPAPASARTPPDAARPVPAAATPSTVQRPAAAAPTRAPDVLPAPSTLLQELGSPPASSSETGASPGDAATEAGLVEAVVDYGHRTPRSQPMPVFPEVLRREGREADVTVRVKINPQGGVEGVVVEQSSGDTSVDNAVERIVRGYLFDRTDGDTIDEGIVTFHFRLKKGF